MVDKKNTRALIIGWDGGSFNVLDAMLKQNLMPNLRALLEQGVRSDFISTLPPITAPAWTSLRTGKQPAAHGIYSFFKQPVGTLENTNLQRNSAADIPGLTFWNVLNLSGKRVCIVDMPLTDPVEQINGVMVSGMMTRGKRKVETYPDTLRKELIDEFPDYFHKALTDGIDVSSSFLDHLLVTLEWKKQQDIYLMENCSWDCFMTVFSAVDLLQHYFWKFIDPDSVFFEVNTTISHKICRFFKSLDTILGEYLEHIDDDDYVYIVSDHGFGPMNYSVYVNNILEEIGCLKLKRTNTYLIGSLFDPLILKKILKRFDFLSLRTRFRKEFREHLNNVLFKDRAPIDWSQTKAYLRVNSDEGIYINCRDKFRDGPITADTYEETVNVIIQRLREATNPVNGERVFEFVKKRGEVYKGTFVQEAPDIILRPAKGYALAGYRAKVKSIELSDKPFLSGTHSQRGIFIAKGPGYKRNVRAKSINIEDFTPNLLYSLGTALPGDLDGQVSLEMFDDNFLESSAVFHKDYGLHETKNFLNDNRQTDEDEIRRQLSKLGYIE
ncbi:alkaline phosphatase family protein [Candidatus Pacearchaeota archaeon]|nr:alkaline phosphatase family protein [Candidatus Pacearchaeota archaeon]